MDFGLQETERELCELAESMLRDFSTPERLLKLEESGLRVDRELWAALKEAGITTIGVEPEHGGTGLGFGEACLVFEQVGKTVAAVPLLIHDIALQTLQRAGTLEALHRFVAADGWLAASARTDRGNSLCEANGRVTGTVSAVPYAPEAEAYLLPARADGSWSLYLVPAEQQSVRLEGQLGTDKSPMGRLTLDRAQASRLGDATLLEWLRQRLIAGCCAIQSGVVEETIKLTTAFVSEHEVFGVKEGSFQAVSQRMADTCIDSMTLQLMSRHVASLLAAQDDAVADVLAAKLLAGDVGHRVLASCQHVHGGIGHDRSYPLWRYAVAAKQIELAVTSSSEATAALGNVIAAQPDLVAL
ncbi:MAG: Acyl-CoA dehydrogenase FadE27 [Steroidobacteraceae bacterium]|nr:Acyl-CoA dehydrogenase FadE27 [Steroidobacteraceae bacterium]